jgi:fumarate reductase subunit C
MHPRNTVEYRHDRCQSLSWHEVRWFMAYRPDLAMRAVIRRQQVYRRWPARLDILQSASGLFLALFLIVHLLAESSILLGKDAMYRVTLFFEGYYFFGTPYPFLVSLFALFILVVLVLHAVLALRKIPANYRQYRAYQEHRALFRHTDTQLWWIQVYTGFALFFLASVHLYDMLSQPGNIGPYASADRVVSGGRWPLYLLLLLAAVVHGGVGLYRLGVKWGWLPARDPGRGRQRMKWLMQGYLVFLLLLGLASLTRYAQIGIEHRDRVGERYIPTWLQPLPEALPGRAADPGDPLESSGPLESSSPLDSSSPVDASDPLESSGPLESPYALSGQHLRHVWSSQASPDREIVA